MGSLARYELLEPKPSLEWDLAFIDRDVAAHRVIVREVAVDAIGKISNLIQLVVICIAEGLVVSMQIT